MATGSAWAMALTADGPIRPDVPSRPRAPDAGVTVDIVTERELPTQALLRGGGAGERR